MKTFKFLYVEDHGPCDNGHASAVCPHCGAEGRYVYHWEEDGEHRAAMAGCYKMLTGHLQKDDFNRYFQLLSEKQAKNKPLNSWDRTVLRMLDFKKEGKYPDDWCDSKISEAIRQRARYLREKHY